MTAAQTPDSPVLTIPETANLLRVSTFTVRRLAHSGRLPSFRIGRRLLFQRAAVLAFVDQESAQAQQRAAASQPRPPESES